ncbi:BMC_2a_G0026990.mRNA.1.CDS.1 [Saccharomyces cerevisiae]|nr:Fet4p [Saccharomyces cerevisiae YJM1447]CAI4797921.1 BMC_2a_G0026990.mRNA.1.CDS.1 [Saccharomyces cerevisiae]CAI4805993.1 BMB_G0027010.mRNA.1.CDS.1 [Saccharomyces cerevisiae]CAI7356931.1 BMC_2a_G0026990.mRNA.1.CDS.1 [Saccharomyces cerevisiae]CAI7359966.1 BMB_G0027010.mRNA.1.CDS.1 [Saccharomyces cerevisiae]
MGKIAEFLGNPGARPDVHHRAPTVECKQYEEFGDSNDYKNDDVVRVISHSDESTDDELCNVNLTETGAIFTSKGFTGLSKGFTDKSLDFLVRVAGSQAVFFIVWIIIIIWVVIGIVYNAPFNWQVVMQDGQSIQSYVWDTLLMRQQLMSTHEQILICGRLKSRLASFKNYLTRSTPKKEKADCTVEANEVSSVENHIDPSAINGELPVENWYDRLSNVASRYMGSIAAMVIFWIGIFVWIGCGAILKDAGNTPPYTGETTGSNPRLKKFSDAWQMYINTAVAVSLLICTTFLQNIRARHDYFTGRFLVDIFDMDEKIDYRIRKHFNDFETPHPVVTIESKKRSTGRKMIDWYADIIGTGIGVLIGVAVFATWIGIGSPMKWDDNWWLIIGTYTGLIGFLDGFVLREVYFRIVQHEEKNYSDVAREDLELFQELGIECPEEFSGKAPEINTIGYRTSQYINRICSTPWSVLVSVIIIIGLICIASGLRWSTTGQLIANTPTMIIEEFFLLVLLQAHNWADRQRRVEVTALYARRRILLSYVEKRFPEVMMLEK